MADQGGQAGQNNGTKVASFKIPYAWDSNAPKFTTEDHEDLMTFVDHVEQIITLAGIQSDQEKKLHLTNYLGKKKKDNWRALKSYTEGSYEDFLKEVYKSYPEIKSERAGTVENLKRLCKLNKGITVFEEGKLRRFGIEFLTLYKKLCLKPALITNQVAVKQYLETLETSFSRSLSSSIRGAVLLKAQIPELARLRQNNGQQGGNNGNADEDEDEDRKEDPIKLADLIKMAEALAASQDNSATSTTEASAKRETNFPLIKEEPYEEKIEEINGAIAQLKDQYVVNQKANDQRHAEILKAMQQLSTSRESSFQKDPPPHREQNRSNFAYNTQSQPRAQENRWSSGDRGCFYCEDKDHFSRECPHKEEHITKGFLAVENGKHKLGDGNYIPGGPGSQKQRVEAYWKNKSVSQNWASTSDPYDERDSSADIELALDEIKTLKVKLARIEQANVQHQIPQVVQPTYVAQTQQSASVPANVDLSHQTIQALLMKGLAATVNELPTTQEQFAQTRLQTKSGPNF